jgi:hypothetical protein
VQLTLALIERASLPARPDDRLDPEARVEALEILARMIAQALDTASPQESADA